MKAYVFLNKLVSLNELVSKAPSVGEDITENANKLPIQNGVFSLLGIHTEFITSYRVSTSM